MQTEWRLERTFLTGAGLDESRLEGLDITWSDPLESTAHAALWADNGTGKTMITALRYALYLPHPRDFIRGDSDRSLAKLVQSRDVCHVIEQASRFVNGEHQRIVVGMVADWPDGGTQDLDNPSRLHRVFYGWLTDDHGPTIDDLPFRTPIGRWATRAQFVEAVRALLPHGGAAPPHPPSNRQGEWHTWLAAAGVDLDQIRFQAVMNASEGGVDRVMRFADSDDFVRWLIGTTMPTSTVEQITNSIDTLRRNATARPHWEDELNLWQRIIDPLLGLAIAYERVAGARRTLGTAEADATSVVADADATLTILRDKRSTATKLFEHHDQARRDAGTTARRAQAHRLRMQLRAAELRVQQAESVAAAKQADKDTAVRALMAWRLVSDVLHGKKLTSTLAGLEERREAAEQETEQLRGAERQHRHDLARLLTHHRDTAAGALLAAERRLVRLKKELADADKELQTCIAAHAQSAEQMRGSEAALRASEQKIADAVSSGLLAEGADPSQRDAVLADQISTARGTRTRTDEVCGRIANEEREARREAQSAQQRAQVALDDANRDERDLTAVVNRLTALINDSRFQDVIANTDVNLWVQRTALTDALDTYAGNADTNAATARKAITEANRVIDSVGTDRLLPPSATVEKAVNRCATQEIRAWSGWKWLADTMTATEAAEFAEARPEIASGVVIAHPDLLDPAVSAIIGLDLDVALWVGAVVDPDTAQTRPGEPTSTRAQILLPPAGVYDREAAERMVGAAADARTQAHRNLTEATSQGGNSRAVLAALQQLWSDNSTDPRSRLQDAITTAQQRHLDAKADEQSADNRLVELEQVRKEQDKIATAAQQIIDDAAEDRRLLVPVISAADTAARAYRLLPTLRDTVADLGDRIQELRVDMPRLTGEVSDANDLVGTHRRAVENATEQLREAGLSPVTDGPVPVGDHETIRARLTSIEDALADAAVDPALYEDIRRTRQDLSDVEAVLGVDAERRELAESFAASEGARHPVAVTESVRIAEEREATAREACGKADAAAENAQNVHRQRVEDRADRSAADVEGFLPAARVATSTDADRFARQLDELAQQLLETRGTEERLAKEAELTAQQTEASAKLIETSAKQLRHLASAILMGRAAENVDELVNNLNRIADEVRSARDSLSADENIQRTASDTVHAHANSSDARAVEDREDSRIGDLIRRLRADQQLPADAERLAMQLEQRAATLSDDLADHDRRVRMCAQMLHIQAATAIEKLRHYQNQSRLPEGLGEWSGQRFVVIEHDPVPTDESVAVDRVARIVHALLIPGAGRSDAQAMLFAATRALVDAPFRVKLLKPHIDLALDRVDVAELKNFSGGQRVTAGVLMYATMTRVRAAGDASSIGWLWLDNPFGQASADQFIRTMRLAADKLGLQLVFTAAPKDKGALSMFDRIIALARRSRPSSGEKVIVIDDGKRQITDLMLVQNDVLAVLGE
ncbi:hypothetical protein ACIBCN_39680 [Nocardia sp. NPDC051052]|uniref:hypothetical protein n=1 Tax=Nocardia sp. NPDC051052 TaxID=3364322 RepID=UPI0037AA2D48